MLSLLTRRAPATESLKTPVNTVFPRHVTFLGMPTLTDTNVPTGRASVWTAVARGVCELIFLHLPASARMNIITLAIGSCLPMQTRRCRMGLDPSGRRTGRAARLSIGTTAWALGLGCTHNEYRVAMTTRVPEATPAEAVDDIRTREAARSRELERSPRLNA